MKLSSAGLLCAFILHSVYSVNLTNKSTTHLSSYLQLLPEAKMSIEQLSRSKGFELQSHLVHTEDGYILKLFRIPPRKRGAIKAVLLQHGLFDSSDSWLVNREEHSLPLVLAKEGWDVWLGNNRGNKHSRQHETLNPDKDAAFWSYSFHEMGLFDLPAMADFIIKEAKVERISLIGHSQGTAQFFSAFSLKPDYFQSRINGFVALGPVTALNNIKSTFLKFVAEYKIDSILNLLGVQEVLPSPQSVHEFTTFLCDKIQSLCDGLLELLSDSNPSVDDKERLLVFISHFPSGTSLQSLMHFGQIIREKKFASFQDKVEYKLGNISGLPICLLVGRDDKLSTVEDNRILRNTLLESEVLHFYKEYENMGHATFFLNKTKEYILDVLRCLGDFS